MKKEIADVINNLPVEMDLLQYKLYLSYVDLVNKFSKKELTDVEFNEQYVKLFLGDLGEMNGKDFIEILGELNKHFLNKS